jgi:hypothetical protein
MQSRQSVSEPSQSAPGLAAALPAVLINLGLLYGTSALAEMSAEELAKLAQNPIANLISVPFQNNTNFNYGPEGGTQNILNIQPVIPITVNKDWNLITRTIFPLIWQPELSPTQDSTFGLGDTQFSAFLSPSDAASGWVWGMGAIAQAPTHSDSSLGNNNWGLGPTAVALRLKKGSPWVYGLLVNNIWSLGNSDAPSYNNGLIQPFLNYNFKGGTYLTSAPIITVNWDADSDDQWTVPVGGGIGRIFHLGRLPVNTQISGYANVVTPENEADWQLRAQVQLMFPK